MRTPRRTRAMAEWRVIPGFDLGGREFWWLMSGNNTLGKIYGERTAKLIVKEHNAPEPVDSSNHKEASEEGK